MLQQARESWLAEEGYPVRTTGLLLRSLDETGTSIAAVGVYPFENLI